jgi:hypothetical protein
VLLPFRFGELVSNSHRTHIDELLRAARAEHAALLERLPEEMKRSVPVDAQGITRAIDRLAAAAGFSEDERRGLVRPHAINPAVMHARVFGGAPLTRDTVIASFVEGARVRAEALGTLADGGAGTGGAADRGGARPSPLGPCLEWCAG